MTQAEQSFSFKGLSAKPVPSILRGFSAPVILNRSVDTAERAFLLAHDTDPFNRWEAGRALAKDVLARMITAGAGPDPTFLDGVGAVLRDDTLDPDFRALVLRLPSEDDMAQTLYDSGVTPDPTAIHTAHKTLTQALADHLAGDLDRIYGDMAQTGPYSPEARAAGARALRLGVLTLIAKRDAGAQADALFRSADNMTEQLGALAILLDVGHRDAAQDFYDQWSGDRLVMDKWFMLQITQSPPEQTAAVTRALTEHPDFDWKNPNRFRSVLGALSMNTAGFHDPSGDSYRLLADWIIKLDALNPQTAARMTTAFETWGRYDADRQALMRGALKRIAGTTGLSRDVTEMTGRMLGESE